MFGWLEAGAAAAAAAITQAAAVSNARECMVFGDLEGQCLMLIQRLVMMSGCQPSSYIQRIGTTPEAVCCDSLPPLNLPFPPLLLPYGL